MSLSLPLRGFLLCFFFPFFPSGLLWELDLCAPESILRSELTWHAPFYTDVFMCVLGPATIQSKVAVASLFLSLGLHSSPVPD